MLKPEFNPHKLADMMARKENGCAYLTHDQYEYWLETVKDQITFKIGDQADDGFVIKYHGMFYAFWFTGVRFSEGFIDMHTAQQFAIPFEALECLTDILKTDHEQLQEEAVERLHRFADEVA